MDEEKLSLAKDVIDQQIIKIERIFDKRADNGQHFDDFLREEKARLFGMLQIYRLFGGSGFEKYTTK